MKNSKIKEQIINANYSRLKIISLISLGFSVFVLCTDFLVKGIWQDESLYLYKVIDIVFAIISVSAVFFFWSLKFKNINLKKTGIVLFPFLFIILSSIITGIDFTTLGFSTLLIVMLIATFFLYLNLTISLLYFVSSGLVLMATIYLKGNNNEQYLSVLFTLIPIIGISVFISARNYKYKLHDLFNQEKMVDLNKKLHDYNQNLEREVEKRTEELIIANKELTFENDEKEKRAAELILANKELVFQNKEKAKRATELVIANQELAFQDKEKEKRAVELIFAKDKAEESDRLKTAFMNNISHEIRTPLNGIIGFAPFVIQSDITMEEKEEYLEILNFSSDRLINTINDIMDISLIISGNMEVHTQPFDIFLLLTNVFENFQKLSMKKNLELKMQFPDNVDNFILNTDGEILRKAVSKLVDNSIKFTKEGSITLGFELINNEIEIFVKDTGQGIEKDSQELIYKSFMQENVSRTRGHEGSGLGLSISKGIIQLLGGEIRLESTKNVGTTVFLTLPNITSTASSKPKNLTNAIKVEGRPEMDLLLWTVFLIYRLNIHIII